MFSYARRCLTSRAPWAAALGCAPILALPGSLLATLFIQPLTMLLLTGDLALALDVLPEAVTGGARRAWIALAVLLTGILGVLYSRLYALLLWASDDHEEEGWRSAWTATRGRWRRLLVLHATFLGAVLLAIVVVAVLVWLTLDSPSAASMILLGGAGAVLVLRTIGRIFVTLAGRAIVLEDRGLRKAWRGSRAVVKERRRQIVSAWAMLLAAGAAVWLGGRVVTPILQDTALDFPALSGYTFAREGAQLAFAIPLEAFLLVFSAAVWTAVYRDVETEARPQSPSPWLPRALAALVVLVIVGNGIPAFIDVAWQNDQDEKVAAIRDREIEPEDALRPQVSASGELTSYRVAAVLDDDRLEWSTAVAYTNRTGAPVNAIPVYVYPAAYERELNRLPLADDVLSSSVPAEVRTLVRPGSFDVRAVTHESGTRLRWDLDDTLMTVEPAEPLSPRERIRFQIDLEAELPVWPARYGMWNDLVQLGNWIPTVAVDGRGGYITHPYGPVGDPFFARVADYDVRLEVDEEIDVVGTGTLTSVGGASDGRRVWRFVAPRMRDAAFAAGRALRGLEDDAQGTEVRAWFSGDETLAGGELVDEAVASVEYYSEAYGPPSFDEIDVVFTESPLGGMEYPGLVYVSAGFPQLEGLPFLPELVAHSGFDSDLQRYIAGHELAHQWWFADVGSDQVLEPWLDEAFAEASTRLWLLEEDGDDRTAKIAHGERNVRPRRGVIDASVNDFDSNATYSDAIYDGGSAILLELRDSVGADTYDTLMREWHSRFTGRIGTVDDFIETVGDVGGPEARAFLENFREGS